MIEIRYKGKVIDLVDESNLEIVVATAEANMTYTSPIKEVKR